MISATGCFAPAAGAVDPPSNSAPAPAPDEVIVRAQHVPGSVILNINPVAVLNEDMIRSLGANNLKELMQRLEPLSASGSGAGPVTLLNGRRISAFGEIENLPPEAIERTEILSEQEAPRFGFPPTTKIVNLITKKRYRGTSVLELGGTTTEGGGGSNYVELNSTRIDGPRRFSLNASFLREFPLRESQRNIVPEGDALFSIEGNIRGLNGGSIDPALDSLAGFPVILAAVPSDPASRRQLITYTVDPNRAAITDTRAVRSLQEGKDTLNLNGTLAGPIGKKMDGSINLSIDSVEGRRLNGLAPALLTVPGSSDALPFSTDVLLYRYLPGAILRQSSNSLTLRGGATLQGGVGQWAWNVTSSCDHVRGKIHAQQGLNVIDLQASIDGGGDPLAAVDTSSTSWLVDRSKTVTNSWISKAVSNGPIVRMPAGDAQLTLSADYTRSASSAFQSAADNPTSRLARTIKGGSASAVVPIASSDNGVLSLLGTLSLNGMVGVADVSRYGRLASFNYGMTWKPAKPLQLSASVNNARAAPDIALLTNPVYVMPNTPFFDFATGNSVVVTTTFGGNPDLGPERRRVTSLSVDVHPFSKLDLGIGVDYFDTRIQGQSIAIGSATAAFEDAYPTRFIRDDSGDLTSVDLRPVNVARERERKIRAVLSLSTALGRKPKPLAGGQPEGAGSPKPSGQRASIDLVIAGTWRLEDRARLQADGGSLDLLHGDTLTGVGGRPQWEIHATLSGTTGALNFGIVPRLQGPTRIVSALPTSDLRFSSRIWIVPYGSLDLERVVKRPWAHALSVQLTVENLLNSRIKVRDRNGDTPYRFQSAFIDPLGRSVRLGVRKVF
jgi:hypothetical protein